MNRSLPSAAEAGAPNDRQVLMFYYICHQRTAGGGPYDLTKSKLRW